MDLVCPFDFAQKRDKTLRAKKKEKKSELAKNKREKMNREKFLAKFFDDSRIGKWAYSLNEIIETSIDEKHWQIRKTITLTGIKENDISFEDIYNTIIDKMKIYFPSYIKIEVNNMIINLGMVCCIGCSSPVMEMTIVATLDEEMYKEFRKNWRDMELVYSSTSSISSNSSSE